MGENEVEEEIQMQKECKITIHQLEMPEILKTKAIEEMKAAMEKCTVEKDIAAFMKRKFDDGHGPTWHCIVGKGFGGSVAYDTQYLIFFQIDQTFVLLFKSMDV